MDYQQLNFCTKRNRPVFFINGLGIFEVVQFGFEYRSREQVFEHTYLNVSMNNQPEKTATNELAAIKAI